jgi:predicted esterase
VWLAVLLLCCSAFLSSQDAKPPETKPGLPSDVKASIKKLIKDLFDAKGHEAKAAVLQKIEEAETPYLVTKADIEDFKKTVIGFFRTGPTLANSGRVKFSHPDYPGEYIIKAGGGKCALFIGLHGGGQGVGDGGQIASLFGAGVQGAVVIYPTVVQKDATAWNTEREEQYVLELIEAAKRTFAIDTNRIYLAGHSMGGYGTWSIGGRHADVFAALAPMSGGIFTMGNGQGGKLEIAPGCAANLKNTPVWFTHGANDQTVPPGPDRRAAEVLKELKDKYGPYDFVYKEYPNIGHGLPSDGVGPIFQWMGSKTRNPYPKMVIWEPTRAYKKLMWWVKLRQVSGGFNASRIVVKIDSGNKFVVEQGAQGMELYINERMGVSLAKEIVVVDASGKELYKGKPDYSIAALVDSLEAKRDPELYFYAKIKL